MRIPKQIEDFLQKTLKSKNQSTYVIVKLAGIGDVAMACRAVNEVFGTIENQISLHWVIDANYVELARSLLELPKQIQIHFHGINSKKLLSGSKKQKAEEALGLLKTILLINPDAVALLHRDWRYKLFIRPAFIGPIFSIKSLNIHEMNLYKMELIKLINRFHLSSAISPVSNPDIVFKNNSIGFLIGGGSGTKTSFIEKRWPYLFELIFKLLNETNYSITLFGSGEDLEIYNEFLKNYTLTDSQLNRISNLIGKLQINEVASHIKSLQFFVSADSGLAHIASNVMKNKNQKIISLFGPTNPTNWAPYDDTQNIVKVFYNKLECSPCYLNDGKFNPCIFKNSEYQKCMKSIHLQSVFDYITH